MRRFLRPVLIATVLGGAPALALAHGFGQRYDLPVPLWLYLYGAAAAVALSFIVSSLFLGASRAAGEYPRYNLLRNPVLRAVLLNPVLVGFLRLASVALLVLVIVAGLVGAQVPTINVTPTMVWIIWWIGLAFASILFGNVWAVLNPWLNIYRGLEALARRFAGVEYLDAGKSFPERLGILPALLVFIAFVWIELVYRGAAVPYTLGLLALAYTLFTLGGMLTFGPYAWLRHGEVFSIYFGILARVAPVEIRVREAPETTDDLEAFSLAPNDRKEINLRLPAAGLLSARDSLPGETGFVLLMLASVTFDGLQNSAPWIDFFVLQKDALISDYAVFGTIGLAGALAVFAVVYLAAMAAARVLGSASVGLDRIAALFIYSLVPIAAAYNVAHYFTYFLISGQRMISLASDPLGMGWDLFGTAGYEMNAALFPPAFVWYLQVGLIIAGHVAAVAVAHIQALRSFGSPRKAMLSQLPVLVLMVAYTVVSLWIISQETVNQ